jgi:hypothetical protein
MSAYSGSIRPAAPMRSLLTVALVIVIITFAVQIYRQSKDN